MQYAKYTFGVLVAIALSYFIMGGAVSIMNYQSTFAYLLGLLTFFLLISGWVFLISLIVKDIKKIAQDQIQTGPDGQPLPPEQPKV